LSTSLQGLKRDWLEEHEETSMILLVFSRSAEKVCEYKRETLGEIPVPLGEVDSS